MAFRTVSVPDDFSRLPVDYSEVKNPAYHGCLACKMIDDSEIRERTIALAQELAGVYAGEDPLVIGVLKGAKPFHALLVRELEHYGGKPYARATMQAQSMDGTKSSGKVKITRDLLMRIEGRPLVVVEDIVDTGLTAKVILEHFEESRPASVALVSMLHKRIGRPPVRPADYALFSIPEEFVVGYGLDIEQQMRDLPHIYVLNDEGKRRFLKNGRSGLFPE